MNSFVTNENQDYVENAMDRTHEKQGSSKEI